MEVEVIDSSPSNIVVTTSGRRFPALVIQGDTFHGWVTDLKAAVAMAQSNGQAALAEELEAIVETLEQRLAHYEAALAKHGIEKPY